MNRGITRRLADTVGSRALVWLGASVVVVCLLVGTVGVLTGTFGGPPDSERSAFVALNNSADTTRTFEVWLGRDPITGITVHRSTNGDYTTKTFPGGIGTSNVSSYHVTTSMSFPKNATLYGRYTLEPGDEVAFNVTEPYPETVFAIVVYNRDHVTVWKTVRCPYRRWGVMVEATNYGAPGTHYC
ncbi:hypothetical protein [Halogeometricum sp. CBA1124]|uniref:hypothetical protein n=1 Tax=Halogeometricum sp. CBA1124 TaxID=2668071 RepID=UPI00142A29BF|nr:hypothetical protein [Halogeometricum sp. CBA1124]MUV59172.1 hypothetical protein [Halogeometricum sp. CBA1124]